MDYALRRSLRRALGVQVELLVPLVVEIVSTGYYRMICRYCGDVPLAAMCKLILRDEVRHIDFHRDRLAARHPGGFGFWRAAQLRLLGEAYATFHCLGHGRALLALGGRRAELLHHVRSGGARFLRELAQLTKPAPAHRATRSTTRVPSHLSCAVMSARR